MQAGRMNDILKPILLTLVLLGAIRAAAVVPATLSASWNGAQTIPDNNASGLAFSFNLAADSPLFITDVTVGFTIVGGWNGDLYATLSHDSGFSVLLNRIGSSAANSGGSAVSGLSIELADRYLEDVHTATANPLTGNYAPDGRFVNPFNAVDTDPRTARFDSFTGLDPNGNWTLFIADVSPLAVSTIQSWTVNVGVAVPEPGRLALVGLALGMGLICHRQRQ
jgi:subtilisin-like proprotein convertase family protein